MDDRLRDPDRTASGPPADPAVEKLRHLIAYIEQVVKLDERAVFRLSEHRLASGQQLVLHQHEVQGLPGVRLDSEDEDGPVWLALERLKREDPPPPLPEIAPWIDLSPDPDREPKAREFLLRTVAVREKETLVASGEARAEDCAAALAPEGKPSGAFDVRLRLEDRPEFNAAIEVYRNEVWRPWAQREQPRRRAIALYQGLFEVAQLAALGTGDQPFELVWGVGLARWQRDGREIDLPIIERPVEIELNEAEGAEIRVRQREAAPTAINLRAFEELKVEGVPLALDAGRRLLASAEAEGAADVSPFEPDSYEPILRACQARLDADGHYRPEPALAGGPGSPPAPAGPHLAVSGRWVLFARRRSDSFILGDLEKLKEALADAGSEPLPGPARTLVMGPGDGAGDQAWTPLENTIGATQEGGDGDGSAESSGGDLFFPKPFNDDQVEIVRRLETAEGIVVQGPPGTGKTHTIANIICHAMATGRRVLVVSHGEPALAVLRDQLPEGVRDLAISITATEREGLKQLETAIRVLQSIVEGLKPGEQLRLVRDLEGAVARLRARLAAVDAELAAIARRQLEPAGPGAEPPAELAAAVAASRDRFAWFTDRPAVFASESGTREPEVEALRVARRALGPRLKEIDSQLPPTGSLPDGATLARWHDDLVASEDLSQRAARDDEAPLRIPEGADLPLAERAVEALAALREMGARVAQEPWLGALRPEVWGQRGTLNEALRRFVADAGTALAERGRFLSRAVELPEGLEDSTEAVRLIAELGAGEQVFTLFNFRARTLRPLIESIRVDGHAPADASDWAHVRDQIAWRASLRALASRWQAIAPEIGAPPALADRARSLHPLVLDLDRALNRGPAAVLAVEDALARLGRTPIVTPGWWHDRGRLERLDEAFRRALAVVELGRARGEVRRLEALFSDQTGTLGGLALDLLRAGIGRRDLAGEAIAHLWDRLLELLAPPARHPDEFKTVRALADAIAARGAPGWAYRLRSEAVAGPDDPLAPADWSKAWDWGASAAYLAGIDHRARSGALSEERARLDAELRRTFERLVRERTFYALGGTMKPRVRGALMMFATALRRTGRGTGKGAGRHRREARSAMALCYDAIPCWIMPSWRVAEQLPARLGSFDLVILDEASQSDIRELPALLRGKKILVVGDDRQVSPTAAFIPNAALDRLEHGFLKGQPFRTLLLPGSSLYDLAKVMFPDKLVMLREHFRCVEPIIRFSMQFYPEPLVPLRIPTAGERLDPALIDIFVPDGRRTGDKVNAREAEVIVAEIAALVADSAIARVASHDRWRSIGVISLIGAKQAALINRMLLDQLGEAVVLRHRIACGDSATFQGNERDVVFLSMVADSRMKQAQTATHFEQRFNVALSRARDRLVLVRSVREDELNPLDLKARVIRHFREPMAGVGSQSPDPEAACESEFERAVLRRLVALGYRVRPQVGALGYRIDLVVEGAGERRLAIECDGDRHHGPERWADDMSRQRVLERVGWRFWRCWASSFALDPEGCMADLVATLERAGIKPNDGGPAAGAALYTLHRTAEPAPGNDPDKEGATGPPARSNRRAAPAAADGLRVGDRVAVRRIDDGTAATYTLSEDRNDPVNGWLGAGTPLGQVLLGCSEEDEVECDLGSGPVRMLVTRTERGALQATP